MPSLRVIVSGLNAVKRGPRWVAKCPAHNDKHPSLHIVERNGKVWVICRAGCEQKAVIRALMDLGLWEHDPERQQLIPDTGKERRLASLWRWGMMLSIEAELVGVKAKIASCLERNQEPPRRAQEACHELTRQHLWLRKADEAELVAAYKRQLAKDKQLTNRRISEAIYVYDEWCRSFCVTHEQVAKRRAEQGEGGK